jgi:hypothetical protein
MTTWVTVLPIVLGFIIKTVLGWAYSRQMIDAERDQEIALQTLEILQKTEAGKKLIASVPDNDLVRQLPQE